MFTSFLDMEEYVKKNGIVKRIALASAHDDDVLEAVTNARKRGVASAILIGKKEKIKELLTSFDEKESDYEIIDMEDERDCARLACSLVKERKADIPMKGLMQTSTFMRAILDKQSGFLKEGALLSQASVLELKNEKRLIIVTDCAVNIAPNYGDKVKILNNAVTLAKKLGIKTPKAAAITPVEVVNPAIQATIDAAMLSKAAERRQIKDCIVDGPLGLDNAVSKEAAKHKGIESPVAGEPDILLMPDLNTGNVFTKGLVYFSDIPSAGTLNGTTSPVVMTSRTDLPINKYYAILTAILQAQ